MPSYAPIRTKPALKKIKSKKRLSPHWLDRRAQAMALIEATLATSKDPHQRHHLHRAREVLMTITRTSTNGECATIFSYAQQDLAYAFYLLRPKT